MMKVPHGNGASGWTCSWYVLYCPTIHPSFTASQGKLSRAMRSHPTHADIFTAASDICASTITEVESGLADQVESDAVEEIRRQEEDRCKAEMEWIADECHEREKRDRLKKIEQDRLDIEAAERELHLRKQSLSNAQKGADAHDYDIDDDDNDNGSMSMPDRQPVCQI